MQDKNIFIFIFCSLSIIATLFPPCNWGDEKLQTKQERMYYRELDLPIKEYSFIFSDNKKIFELGWGWDNIQQKSVRNKYTLHRKIIFSELIVQYILIFLLSIIFQKSYTFLKKQ